MTYKTLHNKIPDYLKNLSWFAQTQDIICETKFIKQSCVNLIYNGMPYNIWSACSINIFKKRYQNH